jgi:hypothetical protein
MAATSSGRRPSRLRWATTFKPDPFRRNAGATQRRINRSLPPSKPLIRVRCGSSDWSAGRQAFFIVRSHPGRIMRSASVEGLALQHGRGPGPRAACVPFSWARAQAYGCRQRQPAGRAVRPSFLRPLKWTL